MAKTDRSRKRSAPPALVRTFGSPVERSHETIEQAWPGHRTPALAAHRAGPSAAGVGLVPAPSAAGPRPVGGRAGQRPSWSDSSIIAWRSVTDRALRTTPLAPRTRSRLPSGARSRTAARTARPRQSRNEVCARSTTRTPVVLRARSSSGGPTSGAVLRSITPRSLTTVDSPSPCTSMWMLGCGWRLTGVLPSFSPWRIASQDRALGCVRTRRRVTIT